MIVDNIHKITSLIKDGKHEFIDGFNSFEYKMNISPNIEFTEEGYLIARNVTFGNIQELAYSERELGWSNLNKRVRVLREAGDVFDERSLRSLEGKPITILHPKLKVSSDNVRDLGHGTVLGIPRQDGINMVGDIIIHSKEAVDLITVEVEDENGNRIRELNDKFRDLSLGYKAKLVKVALDLYKQEEIIYNHLAIVPEGRQMNARINDALNEDIEEEGAKKMNILEKIFKTGKKVNKDENGNIVITNEEITILDENEEPKEPKKDENPKEKKEEDKKEEKTDEDNDGKKEETNEDEKKEEKENMKDMKFFQDELVKVNALPDGAIKTKALNDLNAMFYEVYPEEKPKVVKVGDSGFKKVITPNNFEDNKQEQPKEFELNFEAVALKKAEYYRNLTDPFNHKNWKEFNDNFDSEQRKGRSIQVVL